ATAGQVLAVYAAEAAAMGLAGGAMGAAVGLLAQRALPMVLAGLLPADARPAGSVGALVTGVGAGPGAGVISAATPLVAGRRVPPLAGLRRDVSASRRRLEPWQVGAAGVLVTAAVALAAHQVGSWRQGGIFLGGVVGALLVLWSAS